ncbi:hypothetical protein [Salmonella phage PhiSTP1]|nr:hypothetical protein [Salmonella phage PhiSTP1]
MKVYVVCKTYDYEGEALDGVYAKREDAVDRANEINRRRKLPWGSDDKICCDGVEVYEEEVLDV